MSKPSDYIAHPGIVQSIEKDRIQVLILAESACISCKMKNMCSVADMKEKIIDASLSPGQSVKSGDKVNVVMEKSMGVKAIMIAYLLPFVVNFAALFVLTGLGVEQGIAALASLASLALYYFILHKLKDRLANKFSFRVETALLTKD